MNDQNDFELGSIGRAVASGIVIAVMLAGAMVFFLKSTAYPAGSELQIDYAGAGIVFTLVLSYAVWKLKPDPISFTLNSMVFILYGIIAAGMCSAGCTVSESGFVIPGKVFGPFIIAAIVWAIVTAVTDWAFGKFSRYIDRQLEELKAPSKLKNDYLPKNNLEHNPDFVSYMASMNDEELKAKVGRP